MIERAFQADAREAKGLHDGSITRVVRVVDPQPTCSDADFAGLDNSEPPQWWVWRGEYGEGEALEPLGLCPFGVVGDRLIATPAYHDEPPCKHRGCKSHVTHPCEGCGRKWGVTLLDVTDVRVVRVKDITIEDARAITACDDPFPLATLVKILDATHVNPWGRNLWLWLGTVQKVEA